MGIAERDRRIAKNTMALYARMFFSLLVSLYTSRVVLQALGFNDYGLYNVVGGFVSMLGFLNGLLTLGTMRFLTFQIGRNDQKRLEDVFAVSFTIHVLLAILVLILGETVGLWFVENKLNIVPGRLPVAVFVYHLSLLAAIIGIMQTPFNASLIAHEKMGIYAYIGIFDVIMKLVIVLLLLIVNVDKLKMYAIFYFLVSLATTAFYFFYCHHSFKECRLSLRLEGKLCGEMFGYMGWNSLGAVSCTLNGQGITVLLNVFFGTVVNAARGLAYSVSNIVYQFVYNFQTAMKPQIIKDYASGDLSDMHKLIINSAKYSSYLMYVIGLPLFIEIDTVLHLWLVHVPPYTSIFARFTLIQLMIQAIDIPIGTGIHAVGKMKLPNLATTIIYIMILPMSYFAIKLGSSPTIVYLIILVVYPLVLLCDILILRYYTHFPIKLFIWEACLKTTFFVILSAIVPVAVSYFMEAGMLRLLCVAMISFVISSSLIYYKGIDCSTRRLVKNYVIRKLNFR